MKRTYVVTGAASGIGAATATRLAQTGARVIRCDLHDADVTADLTTPTGREELIAGVSAAASGAIDGLVAVAGIVAGDPATVRLNFFGTVACLEGLRPMLAAGDRPDNSFMTGQLVFIDGGAEAILRRQRDGSGEVRYSRWQRVKLLFTYLAGRLRRFRAGVAREGWR